MPTESTSASSRTVFDMDMGFVNGKAGSSTLGTGSGICNKDLDNTNIPTNVYTQEILKIIARKEKELSHGLMKYL
jgi:hypothetical protein